MTPSVRVRVTALYEGQDEPSKATHMTVAVQLIGSGNGQFAFNAPQTFCRIGDELAMSVHDPANVRRIPDGTYTARSGPHEQSGFDKTAALCKQIRELCLQSGLDPHQIVKALQFVENYGWAEIGQDLRQASAREL